jgi:peptidylprolyl isomerase
MREMERRAKQRRRNTIVGASVGTVAVIVALVILAVSLAGGSSSKTNAAATVTPTQPASTESTSPTPPADPCAGTKVSASALHPKMPKLSGKEPTKLVVKDLKKGTGTPAKAGDTLCVTYVGAAWKTGKVFDASYRHGGTAFGVTPLGSAPVIKGWNQGLVGARAGGLRELIIPPSLGYGAAGQPPTIQPNETLVFLVSVESVKPA